MKRLSTKQRAELITMLNDVGIRPLLNTLADYIERSDAPVLLDVHAGSGGETWIEDEGDKKTAAANLRGDLF